VLLIFTGVGMAVQDKTWPIRPRFAFEALD